MNEKPVRTDVDYRSRERLFARGGLLEFELAIDNLDLLIETLKLGIGRLQRFNLLLELI